MLNLSGGKPVKTLAVDTEQRANAIVNELVDNFSDFSFEETEEAKAKKETLALNLRKTIEDAAQELSKECIQEVEEAATHKGERTGVQKANKYSNSVLQLYGTGVSIVATGFSVLFVTSMSDFVAFFIFFLLASAEAFHLDKKYNAKAIGKNAVYIGFVLSTVLFLLHGFHQTLPDVWIEILGGACVVLSIGELHIKNRIRKYYKTGYDNID